jgi:hypothetical protein
LIFIVNRVLTTHSPENSAAHRPFSLIGPPI